MANTFRDIAAVGVREAETGIEFDGAGGMNNGCNCPGIGVAIGGGDLGDEDLQEWTLLDQFGAARVPQVSQVIGGLGITTANDWPNSGGLEGNGSGHGEFIVGVTNADAGDGTVTVNGTANLQTMAVGWTHTPV
jgi:hypothetical protein